MQREPDSMQNWVAKTSQRLRWQLASAGDLPPEERASHLDEELDRLVEELPPARRKEAMRLLLDDFPSGEGTASAPERNEAVPVGLAFLPVPKSLIDMVGEFTALWQKAGPDARAECIKQLSECGMPVATGGAESLGLLGRMVVLAAEHEDSTTLKLDILRARVEMEDAETGAPLDLYAAFSLMLNLVDQSLELDDTLGAAWSMWKELCKSAGADTKIQSPPPSGGVGKHVREYLENGDPSGLAAVQRSHVDAVRLLVAIAGAVGHGGRLFARQMAGRLAAETIVQEVRNHYGSATAEKCWARFEQISNQFTPSEIEYNFQKALASSAEQLFHSTMTRSSTGRSR